MTDIIKGFGDLISSVFEIITSTISTAVNAVVTTFQGIFSFIIGSIQNLFNLAEGVVGLILGNFVIILSLGVVYFSYISYQQRQGNNPQPVKSLMDAMKKQT